VRVLDSNRDFRLRARSRRGIYTQRPHRATVPVLLSVQSASTALVLVRFLRNLLPTGTPLRDALRRQKGSRFVLDIGFQAMITQPERGAMKETPFQWAPSVAFGLAGVGNDWGIKASPTMTASLSNLTEIAN
jgi:hypothetical protein